jgi:hygromycin-B 4-O-kinase
MSKIKPSINMDNAMELLKKLNITTDNISEISDGQIARTYTYTSGNKEFFIQFNQENMSQGTINEIIFNSDFSKRGIPLRKIISYGDYGIYKYSITQKAEGIAFDKLDKSNFINYIPEIIKTLKKIADTELLTSGYGWLDETGKGKFKSWREHLEFVREEEPGMFYENWHELFDTTFLEKDKFDLYYSKMEELFKYIPDVRQLVHSGYCGGNILLDNGGVSAILDWQDARYGDSVFDLAYMTFWMDKEQKNICIEEYIKVFGVNTNIDNLSERIRCYQFYTGIDGTEICSKNRK